MGSSFLQTNHDSGTGRLGPEAPSGGRVMEPELLPAYREEALQYLMTIEMTGEAVPGRPPRLAKELIGVAKMAISTHRRIRIRSGWSILGGRMCCWIS